MKDSRNRANRKRCHANYSGFNDNTVHYKNVDWRAPIFQLVEKFDNDIPHSGSIRSELDVWFIFWTGHFTGNRPDSISSTLKIIDEYAFPDIYAILKILAVIPITTCSCERSISTLRRLKDYKRSTMGQLRLNGLALLHIHKDISVIDDEVVTEFSNSKRRLVLV